MSFFGKPAPNKWRFLAVKCLLYVCANLFHIDPLVPKENHNCLPFLRNCLWKRIYQPNERNFLSMTQNLIVRSIVNKPSVLSETHSYWDQNITTSWPNRSSFPEKLEDFPIFSMEIDWLIGQMTSVYLKLNRISYPELKLIFSNSNTRNNYNCHRDNSNCHSHSVPTRNNNPVREDVSLTVQFKMTSSMVCKVFLFTNIWLHFVQQRLHRKVMLTVSADQNTLIPIWM